MLLLCAAAAPPAPPGRAARDVSPLLAIPLLVTTSASSSYPVPTPDSRARFWYSAFGSFTPRPAAVAPGPLRLDGTVWIVPQCWQRHTPPANASSIERLAWQLVQMMEIMGE